MPADPRQTVMIAVKVTAQSGRAQLRYSARRARRCSRVAVRDRQPISTILPSASTIAALTLAWAHRLVASEAGNGTPASVSQTVPGCGPERTVRSSTTRRAATNASIRRVSSRRARTIASMRTRSSAARTRRPRPVPGVDGRRRGHDVRRDLGARRRRHRLVRQGRPADRWVEQQRLSPSMPADSDAD